MKKNAVKEFIITSVAAAVAGFVVKKGYEYFRSETKHTYDKKKNNQKQLSTQTNPVTDMPEKAWEAYTQSTPAQKGLVATLVYTATAFMVSKVLKKII